jgi:hypothetical protein
MRRAAARYAPFGVAVSVLVHVVLLVRYVRCFTSVIVVSDAIEDRRFRPLWFVDSAHATLRSRGALAVIGAVLGTCPTDFPVAYVMITHLDGRRWTSAVHRGLRVSNPAGTT